MKRKRTRPSSIPTSFDVQALAAAMVQSASGIREASDEGERARYQRRLGGLAEAWTLMTRSEEEIEALIDGTGPTPSEHVTRCLDEALVIAVDLKAYTATI